MLYTRTRTILPALMVAILAVSAAIAATPAWVRVDTAARSMREPAGVAVDATTGTIFVSDTANHRILAISGTNVGLVAGNGSPGFADGGSGRAQFKQPAGLAYDSAARVLYVADSGNHAIRRIDASGIVSTVAGSVSPGFADGAAAAFKQPMDVALEPSGTLIVADSGNHAIRRIVRDGRVSTVAGTGTPGFRDGAPIQSAFQFPAGVAVASDGTIFVADTLNHVIRAIRGGVVATVAGSGKPGLRDGTAASSLFNQPSAVAVDEGRRLYVADAGNDSIRVVDPTAGTVSTIAGGRGFVDGDVALARFNAPSALTLAGALFVADAKNGAIRIMSPQIALRSVSPQSGAPAGGEEVHLQGDGFVPGATEVRFGATLALDVRWLSSSDVVAITPEHAGGVVDVTVKTAAGTATLADGFTYVAEPSITSVSPARGPSAGGQSITITGTNFVTGETSVLIGSMPATGVVVTNRTSLIAITPPGVAGTADIVVETGAGRAVSTGAYTYVAPPAIASFAPLAARAGAALTITGSGFEATPALNTVTIAGLPVAVTTASANVLTVIVPSGFTGGPVRVTTIGGSAQSAGSFTLIRYTGLTITPVAATLAPDESKAFHANLLSSDGSSSDVSASAVWSTSNPSVATVTAGLVRGLAEGDTTIAADIENFHATAAVTIAVPDLNLPPDPASVAPPADSAAIEPLGESTAFLYSGPNPIQTGVAANTIHPEHAAVIRGQVFTAAGGPLSGVTVSVLNHPELGQTLSRADGMFDLAINGGGRVTLVYQKTGFIPAQRQVESEWQQFVFAPDVRLLRFDPIVTPIDLSRSDIQVARGSISNDSDGARRATLLFQPGTGASIVLPDGSRRSVSSLSVRATEYTIGRNDEVMPGALPATSGYTYAVELSADEAVAAAADTVEFSKPVVFYVENFIGFPVGMNVPLGYYNRRTATWQAEKNGRVIKVLGIDGMFASVDTNGDGATDDAATLATLGITDAERQQLASLYAPGQSLWRVAVQHFTPFDCNWPAMAAPGSTAPGRLRLRGRSRADKPTCAYGSIIECQNQTLGEVIPLTDVPYTLNYRSDRVSGHAASRTLVFDLTADTVPPGVNEIAVKVQIAGQLHVRHFAPAAKLAYEFTWDGRDAYGRAVEGQQVARVQVGYDYDVVYGAPAAGEYAFAKYGTAVLSLAGRRQTELSTSESAIVERTDLARAELGAWTFNVHHAYDTNRRVLYLGSGTRRTADSLGQTIEHISGSGFTGISSGDGGPASAAAFNYLQRVAVASDGTVYVVDSSASTVRRIQNGIISRFAGNGTRGFSGDGGPALQAQLNNPLGIAIGADGSVYIGERARIRRVSPGGIITTIAGNGVQGNSGDNLPATQVSFAYVYDIALSANGDIYFADGVDVRKIDGSGICSKVTPAGFFRELSSPNAVAVGPDGSLYIGSWGYIIKRDPSGRATIIAGGGTSLEDGVPARQANFGQVYGLRIGADGLVYFSDLYTTFVRMIRTDGTVTRVAGSLAGSTNSGDGGLAIIARFGSPEGIAFAPDGSLYIVDSFHSRLRRVDLPQGRREAGELFVPSSDGAEVYVFDSGGRHLRTLDALDGNVLRTFGYTAGRLTSVTDGTGAATMIERDASGVATAIVGPGGARTALAHDANGYLTGVTNEAGQTYAMTYDDGGMLATWTTPRGKTHTFEYDAKGMLRRDANPAGGEQTMTRTGDSDNYTVTLASSLGRTRSYAVSVAADGTQLRIDTSSAGLRTTETTLRSQKQTTVIADGTTFETTKGPDPVFGMMAPITTSSKIRTPAGLTLATSVMRTATLSRAGDPFSLSRDLTTVTANGRTSTIDYVASTKTATFRSAAGRTATTKFDTFGHIVELAVPSLTPTTIDYDSRGLVATVTRGARSTSFTYNQRGRLLSMTANGHTTSYAYNAAGRLETETLPGGRVVRYDWDADGNLTGVTPPSRPKHGFGWTAGDQLETYDPPSDTASTTRFAYDADGAVKSIVQPDGTTIGFGYTSAGRLESISAELLSYTFSYGSGGQLASVIPSAGVSIDYTWDGSLLKSMKWNGEGWGSVAYGYDNDLRLVSETVNGDSLSFGYDADGLLTQVGALSLTRDAASGLVTTTTIGAVKTSWSHDELGELSGYRVTRGADELASFTYTRDGAGRITDVARAVNGLATTDSYVYDDAGRLSSTTFNGVFTTTYDYDQNGNRLSAAAGVVTDSATYDDQDRLLSYGATTYSWTSAGQVKTRMDVNGTTTFTYDAMGSLVGVELPDATKIEYVLDGAKRRVGKKVDGTLVRRWLYADDLRIIAELDGAGALVSRFVYGTRTNVPDYMVRGDATYAIISDHLGSPVLVVDVTTGVAVQMLRYDAFGNVLADSNPGFQPFAFAGGLLDRQTGLVRFGVRDYDPRTGRWLSKDPSLFRGSANNLYGYAANDPVNYLDRDGKIPLPVITAAIGAAGGFVGSVAAQLIVNHGTQCFSWKDVWVATGVGAVAGFAAPFTATTYVGAAVSGAVANYAQYGITQAVHGREQDINGAGASLVTGLLGGIIGGPVSRTGAGFSEDVVYPAARQQFQEINANAAAREAVGDTTRSFTASAVSNLQEGGPCGCNQ